SSRRRHTRFSRDWSSDVCSSDLNIHKRYKFILGLGKDVFTLSVGILLAQLIPLLLQPFLKRVFDVEVFGTYDVFLKTFSILVSRSEERRVGKDCSSRVRP